MIKLFVNLLLIDSLLIFGSSDNNLENNEMQFVISRGLNVSHWLSQSSKIGKERKNYITETDFKVISELGFDHVRIPIDEIQMWDEDGAKHQETFDLLHTSINWSFRHNLRVIVDLHVLRSHHFNNPDDRQLWEDKSAQENFINYWNQLSGELKKYPVDKLAYEPLNEAVAEDPKDWNKLINWVISEIRKLEPERTIIMGSNRWQTVGTFKDLQVPKHDPNIILSFHYYEPFILTHYKASWTPLSEINVPINYPGTLITPGLYESMDRDLADQVKNYNQFFDIEKIDEEIKQAVEIADSNGLKLYCGEFGAYPAAPMKLRVKWYRDLITILDKYNIAWTHWNYKNDFPVVDENLKPIKEILDILISKK